MLELEYPWLLLALPLPWLLRRVLPPQEQRVTALRVPFFDELLEASGRTAAPGAAVVRRGRLQMAFGIAVWLCFTVGLAKPQWVGEPIERTQMARDVMLAIDLSGSMDERDFPAGDATVTRFAAVQQVVREFVSEREHDRVGLIVFGSRAYVQLPFTRDLEAAAALVDLMAVGMAGPKTALGDALGLAIRAFEDSDADARILVLLTDGNDTASVMTPVNAAAIAARHGVEVHTIGIGDPDANGEERVDFDVLQDIAQRTGGRFERAADADALEAVYARIDQNTAAEVTTLSWRPRTALTYWPAGAAVVLVLIGYGLLVGRRLVARRA